jgi:hypothetical protein
MSQTKAQLIDNLVQPITGAAGSASAPTFSFTADPNTGLYSPGADQVAVATNGTGRLFVDAMGRLALSPTQKLSINGNLQFEADDGITIGAKESLSVNLNSSGGQSNRVFQVKDNGTARLTVQQAGNVGIGTTSPSTKLQVDGSWVSNYGTLNIAGPDNDLMGVGFRNTSTYLGGVFFRDGTAGDFLELNAQGSRAIRALTNGTERARIDSSGRLLVGTSSAIATQQIQAANTGGENFGAFRFVANTGPCDIVLHKSRGSLGNHTIVQNGDGIACSPLHYRIRDGASQAA